MSRAPFAHVALFTGAGMGHLTPFLRLVTLLLHHNCQVTLITPLPTVSKAETELLSKFFSSFPRVNQLKFHLLPLDANATSKPSNDPFFLQVASICNSCNLLPLLLASLSPPFSAFVIDITLISPLLPIATPLASFPTC
ncbi:hypothetical protein RJT34_06915 [Clitoria ternatea]|uniref:Uncharacterized protein n=1 Tax=Clitoria ternatea TaxID=43366 RepID=A0AAN9K5A6_CLITE